MARKWIPAAKVMALALVALLAFSACTATQIGAGIGAVSGALLGGIIGHQSGHRTEGALVGAAAGGLTGALVGDGIDEYKDRKKERQNQATQEELRQRVDQLEQENQQLRVDPAAPPAPPAAPSAPDSGALPPPPSSPGGSAAATAPAAPPASPASSAPKAPPATVAAPVRYLKKRIAVAPIDVAVNGAGVGNYGKQIHAMLITELRKTNRFLVVEREDLGAILDEQDLAASGRVAAGSGPKTGQLMGAQLLIKPQITDFEDQSHQGRQIGVGPVDFGRARSSVRVAMDVRIFDSETGVVVASENVAAEKVTSSQDLSVAVAFFRWDDQKSQNSTLGVVTRELVQKALKQIIVQSEKVRWTARVMKEAEGKVYFNAGSLTGVRPRDRFNVISVGEQLRDPDTGEVLATEDKPVALIEVVQVEPKFSIGYVVERKGGIKPLDKVVP